MMKRYDQWVKDRAVSLYKLGHPAREVAAKFGVQRVSTINQWVRISEGRATPRKPQDREAATWEWMRQRAEEARQARCQIPDDPLRDLLGDPPPGRRALDRHAPWQPAVRRVTLPRVSIQHQVAA